MYVGCNYVDEKGLGVEEVGELVECLGHCGTSRLRDVQLPCDHHIIGTILGGKEEDAVCVRLVVQERNSPLVQVTGVVLHLNHQVCETKNKKQT